MGKGDISPQEITEAIKLAGIPKRFYRKAKDEAESAAKRDYDVVAWLRYWLQQQKTKLNRPREVPVSPRLIDKRMVDHVLDDFGPGDLGLIYNDYHGWVRDDA